MTKRPDRAKVRSHGRHKVNVPLAVSLARDGKSLHFAGTVVQVGPGGITAEINADLQNEEQLLLDFTRPYSQVPLHISATIRNRSDFRYGLEFQDPTAEQNSAIRRLCETLTLLEG